jgi:hypothetical protein
MKRLINLLVIPLACVLIVISCSKPEKKDTGDKEKTIKLPNGRVVTLEEYQASQGKGANSNKYVLDDSGSTNKASQYHTIEMNDTIHKISIKELSELPPDAVLRPIGNRTTVSDIGSKNHLIMPDDTKDDTDIFDAPRLKRADITINDDILKSAPPILQKLYTELIREVSSLRSELDEANGKLDRVESKISSKEKVKKPYEVKRVQQIKEILSYMRQDMIDKSVYPLEDIPDKYLDAYSIEGLRDDILEEIEKEIAYINRLIAESISFKQRYLFDKDTDPRKVLRLDYDNHLHHKKKK